MDLGPGLACPTLAVAFGLRSTERNSLETHGTTPKTRFKIIENPISGAFFRVLPTLLLQSLMVVGSKRRRKQPASFSASTWCQVMPAVELIDLDYLDVFTSCEPFQVAVEETTEVCGLVDPGMNFLILGMTSKSEMSGTILPASCPGIATPAGPYSKASHRVTSFCGVTWQVLHIQHNLSEKGEVGEVSGMFFFYCELSIVEQLSHCAICAEDRMMSQW